jgi:hypothetical protein
MALLRKIHLRYEGEELTFIGTLEDMWSNYPGAKLVKLEYVPAHIDGNRRWRDIPGYVGLYQISNKQEVKSLARIVKKSDGTIRTISERIMKVTEGRLVLTNKRKEKKSYNVFDLYKLAFK